MNLDLIKTVFYAFATSIVLLALAGLLVIFIWSCWELRSLHPKDGVLRSAQKLRGLAGGIFTAFLVAVYYPTYEIFFDFYEPKPRLYIFKSDGRWDERSKLVQAVARAEGFMVEPPDPGDPGDYPRDLEIRFFDHSLSKRSAGRLRSALLDVGMPVFDHPSDATECDEGCDLPYGSVEFWFPKE